MQLNYSICNLPLCCFIMLKLVHFTVSIGTKCTLNGVVAAASAKHIRYKITVDCSTRYCRNPKYYGQTDSNGRFSIPIATKLGVTPRKIYVKIESTMTIGTKLRSNLWQIDRLACDKGYLFYLGEFVPRKQPEGAELLMLRGKFGAKLEPTGKNRVYVLRLKSTDTAQHDNSTVAQSHAAEDAGEWSQGEGFQLLLDPRGIGYVQQHHPPSMLIELWKIETNVCPICYDEFKGPKAAKKMKGCEHYGHDSCINQWLKSEQSNAIQCPHCQTRIVTNGGLAVFEAPVAEQRLFSLKIAVPVLQNGAGGPKFVYELSSNQIAPSDIASGVEGKKLHEQSLRVVDNLERALADGRKDTTPEGIVMDRKQNGEQPSSSANSDHHHQHHVVMERHPYQHFSQHNAHYGVVASHDISTFANRIGHHYVDRGDPYQYDEGGDNAEGNFWALSQPFHYEGLQSLWNQLVTHFTQHQQRQQQQQGEQNTSPISSAASTHLEPNYERPNNEQTTGYSNHIDGGYGEFIFGPGGDHHLEQSSASQPMAIPTMVVNLPRRHPAIGEQHNASEQATSTDEYDHQQMHRDQRREEEEQLALALAISASEMEQRQQQLEMARRESEVLARSAKEAEWAELRLTAEAMQRSKKEEAKRKKKHEVAVAKKLAEIQQQKAETSEAPQRRAPQNIQNGAKNGRAENRVETQDDDHHRNRTTHTIIGHKNGHEELGGRSIAKEKFGEENFAIKKPGKSEKISGKEKATIKIISENIGNLEAENSENRRRTHQQKVVNGTEVGVDKNYTQQIEQNTDQNFEKLSDLKSSNGKMGKNSKIIKGQKPIIATRSLGENSGDSGQGGQRVYETKQNPTQYYESESDNSSNNGDGNTVIVDSDHGTDTDNIINDERHQFNRKLLKQIAKIRKERMQQHNAKIGRDKSAQSFEEENLSKRKAVVTHEKIRRNPNGTSKGKKLRRKSRIVAEFSDEKTDSGSDAKSELIKQWLHKSLMQNKLFETVGASPPADSSFEESDSESFSNQNEQNLPTVAATNYEFVTVPDSDSSGFTSDSKKQRRELANGRHSEELRKMAELHKKRLRAQKMDGTSPKAKNSNSTEEYESAKEVIISDSEIRNIPTANI